MDRQALLYGDKDSSPVTTTNGSSAAEIKKGGSGHRGTAALVLLAASIFTQIKHVVYKPQ